MGETTEGNLYSHGVKETMHWMSNMFNARPNNNHFLALTLCCVLCTLCWAVYNLPFNAVCYIPDLLTWVNCWIIMCEQNVIITIVRARYGVCKNGRATVYWNVPGDAIKTEKWWFMIMEICILWSTPFPQAPITGNNFLSLTISISPINHFWLLQPGDYLHLSIGYRILYMHYVNPPFPSPHLPILPHQQFHLSWRALLSLALSPSQYPKNMFAKPI